MLTPQQFADKWKQGATAAKYSLGVTNCNVNPMEMAANNAQAALDGYTRSIQSGDWQAALRATPPEKWKKNATGKGAANYARGVQDATQDMMDFAAQFLPHAASVKAQIGQMPPRDAGGPNSRARVLANMDMMMQFKRTGRRR